MSLDVFSSPAIASAAHAAPGPSATDDHGVPVQRQRQAERVPRRAVARHELCLLGPENAIADEYINRTCIHAHRVIAERADDRGISRDRDESAKPISWRLIVWCWNQRMAASHGGEVTGLAVDPRGGVIVAGYFNGAVELAGSRLITKSLYYSDAFLYALDSKGGHVYFGGVQFDNPDSQSRIVVAKLDPEGEHIWSDMHVATPNPFSIDIAVDAHGDMLFAGINGPLIPDPSAPSAISEYFVDKIDPMGRHRLVARGLRVVRFEFP